MSSFLPTGYEIFGGACGGYIAAETVNASPECKLVAILLSTKDEKVTRFLIGWLLVSNRETTGDEARSITSSRCSWLTEIASVVAPRATYR